MTSRTRRDDGDEQPSSRPGRDTVARRFSRVWIYLVLAAGTTMAVVLLAQTAVNYRYVSNNLIEQAAVRVADDRVRGVERAARLSRPQTPEAFQAILDELRADRSDQIAALALRQSDGAVVAASGEQPSVTTRTAASRRGSRLVRDRLGDREVFIGVFPCRCGLPAAGRDPSSPASGRFLLEVALYRDSLSAPFARLRRDAIISASTALTLLVLVALIALRLKSYVSGKQVEAQADAAREVQRDLLPAPGSSPADLDAAGYCVPASHVGGDFYDIVQLSRGRLAFLLGDVSGHGIGAALLMGLIHGAMSSPPWGELDDAADRAARLNELLLTKSSGERFATLFWCVHDPAARTLRYINAGHLPPLWIRSRRDGPSRMARLAEGGPVLGVLASAAYRAVAVDVEAGDLLVLFSDGVVEAAAGRDTYFGEERLIALVEQHRDRSAREICDAVRAAVRAFTADRPAADDETLLVVRLPPGH